MQSRLALNCDNPLRSGIVSAVPGSCLRFVMVEMMLSRLMPGRSGARCSEGKSVAQCLAHSRPWRKGSCGRTRSSKLPPVGPVLLGSVA